MFRPSGEDKKATKGIHPRYRGPEKTPLVIEVTENKPDGGYDLDLKAKGEL